MPIAFAATSSSHAARKEVLPKLLDSSDHIKVSTLFQK